VFQRRVPNLRDFVKRNRIKKKINKKSSERDFSRTSPFAIFSGSHPLPQMISIVNHYVVLYLNILA
jgi:hypothetical protein